MEIGDQVRKRRRPKEQMICIEIMGQRESTMTDDKYQLLEDAFAPEMSSNPSDDEVVWRGDGTTSLDDNDNMGGEETDDDTVGLIRSNGKKGEKIHDDRLNIHTFNANNGNSAVQHEESFWSITFQVMFPFTVAGLGMVGAGIVLDIVQHWLVFEQINELFILVPALLGLKGNLEMTLASRLSTQVRNLNLSFKSTLKRRFHVLGQPGQNGQEGRCHFNDLEQFSFGSMPRYRSWLCRLARSRFDGLATRGPIQRRSCSTTVCSLHSDSLNSKFSPWPSYGWSRHFVKKMQY
jgi:hypothetical protein